MSERIYCPACKRALRLPADCVDPWLSCPRCLARIRNPQSEPERAPSSPGVAPQERQPEARPRCPGCGVDVEPRWLFCPFCEERLRDRLPRQWSGSVEGDVRRDTTTMQVILILLAIVGGLGIFLALMTSFAALTDNEVAPLFVTLAVLFVLTVISAIIVSVREKKSPQPTAARIVLGTITLAGALVAGGCLFMGAIFVFFFVVCLAGGRL
jgi:hypothetical protein